MDKEIIGYISLFFAALTYAPYIWTMIRGKNKPHVFTWIIWTLVMAIGAAGQFAGNAGPGAWASAFTAVSCFAIAILSFKYGDREITRYDTMIFIGALSAIPLWIITKNPLSAIIIVTIIDAVAYIPTFRKSWHRPHEEMTESYVVSNIKHTFSFFAMQSYTWTTLLYPVSLFIMNAALSAMIYQRRQALR